MINKKGYMVSFLYRGGIICPGFRPRRWAGQEGGLEACTGYRQLGKEQMKLETA